MTGDVTLGYMLSRFSNFLSLGVGTSITALNTVGAGAITGAGIAKGVVQRGGAQSGAAFTDTTDTAANILAAIPNAVIGKSFKFVYQNQTNATATISAGTGVTITGQTIVPPNSFVEYLVTYTASGTLTMVSYESASLSSIPAAQFSTGTTTTTFAAGQLTGAEYVVYNNSGATPGSIATRTATQMIADIPNASNGQSWILRVINGQGTGTLTITAGTGVTLTGTMTVAANTWRDFVVTITSTGTPAITIQNAGVGTFS